MKNELYCGGQIPEVPNGNETKKPPQISLDSDNIIVRFDIDETPECRQKIRYKHNVTQFQTCSCGNQNYELWGLDPKDPIDAEGHVRGLSEQKNKSKGERHFHFTFPEVANFKPSSYDFRGDICLSGQEGDKINIAVFDTGIDFRYFKGTNLLYNTSKFGNCPGYSGWNFIEGSQDTSDQNGHGTFVTKIITDILDERKIGYRILPLKVLDRDGKGSLWGLLCALSYLEQIQRNGAQIHLANLSLGGTIATKDFNDSDFLSELIQKLDNDVLFVASAGNEGINTDSGIQSHFPSSYNAENILSVGGYCKSENSDVKVHSDSNYGPRSIDLAVLYDGYKVEAPGLPGVDNLKGTSYGTAYVTAMAAMLYMTADKVSRPKPLSLRKLVLDHANISTNLQDNKIARNRAIVN